MSADSIMNKASMRSKHATKEETEGVLKDLVQMVSALDATVDSAADSSTPNSAEEANANGEWLSETRIVTSYPKVLHSIEQHFRYY